MTPVAAMATKVEPQTEPEATALAGAPTSIDSASIRGFLESHLGDWATRPNHQDRLVRALVPAPVVEPERWLEVAADQGFDLDHSMLWDPTDDAMGPRVAGVGAVALLEVAGVDRLNQLTTAADALFARLDDIQHPQAPTVSPRVFGGLAFDDQEPPTAPPWDAFGGGCFSLPRWLYIRDGEQAGLALTLPAEALRDVADRELAIVGLLTALEALTSAEPAEPAGQRLSATVEDAPDARGWIARVEAIRQAIAAGEVEKIVAARRSVVRLERAPTVPEVLRRLKRGLVASTRFAFCRQHAAFLGATPERLIAKRGQHLETEALAGSIESGGEHAAELLGSGKDRLEQQLVVDAIVRRLQPLCAALTVADRPTVRELKDVSHLHTAIRGQLEGQRHVLELVAMLHPTPAVGGVPTAAAVDWIRQRETHSRGWYAAPVGWFDAAGDGELMVALRSCVLAGDRAWLWAGAGIVADSDPEAELAETALKEQALLGALGG